MKSPHPALCPDSQLPVTTAPSPALHPETAQLSGWSHSLPFLSHSLLQSFLWDFPSVRSNLVALDAMESIFSRSAVLLAFISHTIDTSSVSPARITINLPLLLHWISHQVVSILLRKSSPFTRSLLSVPRCRPFPAFTWNISVTFHPAAFFSQYLWKDWRKRKYVWVQWVRQRNFGG